MWRTERFDSIAVAMISRPAVVADDCLKVDGVSFMNLLRFQTVAVTLSPPWISRGIYNSKNSGPLAMEIRDRHDRDAGPPPSATHQCFSLDPMDLRSEVL
jgi:hypothetical protein